MRGLRAAVKHQRYRSPDSFRILDYFVCPETHNAPTFALHGCSAARVCFNLKGVVISVDLNDKLPGYAREVGKVRTDWVLSAELDAGQAAAPKKLPNLAFGTAAAAPQFARFSGGVLVLAQNAPSPNLSPRGRGT